MKYPSIILAGEYARGETLSVAFAGEGQHQDAGAKMIHLAPHTSSSIISKSIARGGGRTSYRGEIKVAAGAHHSANTVRCDALLVDTISRSDTYPAVDVREDDVSMGHEATVSRISDEQLFYLQSRGLPIAPPADPRLEPFRERGAALFSQRIGQIDLSCATCHDQLAGGRLAGVTIPQGQANGYPLYRLEWQDLGSLPRRIRNCMTGVRAQPLPAHSVEMVELELHLATRALGMAVETPAVRP
jgi:hypothetical protein